MEVPPKPVSFPPCQYEETRRGHQWKSIGCRPFEPDFANNSYLRSYLSLYQGLGNLGEDWPSDITLKEYQNGYTHWCIDFNKDQEAQLDNFHLNETGNLRIKVNFGQNLASTLNCVVYAESVGN